jgi:beta-galactosidase
MFHGGTNFNFYNGANHFGTYEPTVTSYDYGALLSEAGDRTEAYYKFREILKEKFKDKVPELTAKESEKKAYGIVNLTEQAYLFENLDNISKPIHVVSPKYMEDIGQNFGYVLYRTTIKGPFDAYKLYIEHIHDRAQIFINDEHRVTYYRNDVINDEERITLPLNFNETAKLDILVENMGRVNYGPKLRDQKGAVGIRFNNQYHFGWNMYSLPMTDLSNLEFKSIANLSKKEPSFLKGYFLIDETPKDTFIKLEGFTKGFVMINGINIGRYFNIAGPQKTLYVPAPFLKEGKNEIIVFESDITTSSVVEFLDKPEL